MNNFELAVKTARKTGRTGAWLRAMYESDKELFDLASQGKMSWECVERLLGFSNKRKVA